MPYLEELILVLATVVGLIAVWAWNEHRRWQERVERERFVLSMKVASSRGGLRLEQRERLRLLRTPWWALWRWFPERYVRSDIHLARRRSRV